MSEYQRLVTEAMEHLDRLDGTLLPEFVRVPDGFFTRRVVLDEPLTAGWTTEAAVMPMRQIAFHYEPCRIPRYRTEARWVAVLGRT